jgi:L-threonylcarbamoyladenylate synthase
VVTRPDGVVADDGEIERAAAVLRAGGLVAFPTETVYGLGADAANPLALRRLYEVKRRPATHPVIVHLGDPDSLDDWAVDVRDEARLLVAACWPGPLTVVLRRRAGRVPDEVTGGRDTVGMRVPDQPVALSLLRAFGGAVAAPSANRFGRVSPTTADHVRNDLGDDVDMILDGGPCALGVESTIVDCSRAESVILREGGVARERLEVIVAHPIAVASGDDAAGTAPGTLATHYAPSARVEVVDASEVVSRAATHVAAGFRVGVLAEKPPVELPAGVVVLDAPADAEEYARVLYARLREIDERTLDVLLAVAPSAMGIGAAVVDRLRRAATRASAR